MSKPIIAIVGRPNVGKSMLFNKIIGRRLSIVEDTPGVTRDRIYGESDWQGRKFTLIDTGGIEPRTDNQILAFMRSQAQIAIDNATVIVFLCDIKTGMTASDQEVASMLQRCGKPVILIENGKLVQDNLRRTRVTLDELTGHLREKDVLDITAVQYAILETDGNLSVFPFPKERPASARDAGIHPKPQFLPVTIVEDGFLSRENLGRAGKDEAWLRQVLPEHRAEIADTLLLTLDAGNKVVWLGKEYGR